MKFDDKIIKAFNKLRKLFSTFPPFKMQTKLFSKKSTLTHTTSHGFVGPCQNLVKANDPIL